MKIRLADYIANFLVSHGIRDCFTVTGGGAMHLNDALGHKEGLHCVYNHHEQACAMAAEAYARINNRPAAVCVTTGPGGTNAITGVLGAWLDSIPMIVISGQVRYDTSKRGMGLNIRAGGDQEFDIVRAISCMTKYAEMIEDPLRIRYALERSLYLSTHGRMGPCWIDIPVNFQGAVIDTDLLLPYDPKEDADALPPKPDGAAADLIIEKIKTAKRPVFYAGNGIRLAGAFDIFRQLVPRLNIPVVTCWNSIDLMADTDPLYVGRGGIMGDRAGNFAVQNSDLLIAVGNRLSIRQVGYSYKSWARDSFVVMADADSEELKKPTLHVELPIHADAKEFLCALSDRIPRGKLFPDTNWQSDCRAWKKDYPVVLDRHKNAEGLTNPYAFIKALSDRLPEGTVTVVGNGSASVIGSHAFVIKEKQRFIINSAVASMGYDLPAAIGLCRALGGGGLVCISGDGSIQMNLQELQTIITNRMPIKIFVINNGGYHSIRQTQENLFSGGKKVGIGPESKDLSFPSLERLAYAFGYPYAACRTNAEIDALLDTVFSEDRAFLAEIFADPRQPFEPKSATKKLDDGTLVSPPLEDLAPFLPREELKKIMKIPLID